MQSYVRSTISAHLVLLHRLTLFRTCHCTAQFCYVCGSKWKTCDCPWFNYEPGEAEREYVVPDWNAREPVPPQVADRPQRGNRRDQLRQDEEVARRLAREPGPGGEDLAREYYELPPALQIDPLAALGTLGLGLRNGIRRLAADYVAGAPEPRAHLERRRGGAVAGPGLGLGLARVTGGAAAFYGAAAPRPAPAQAAAVNAEANHAAPAPAPRRQPVHVPALQRAPPRSNFLTESQQANVERYLAELDLDDAEPAVEVPFNQQASADDVESVASAVGAPQLRRSNTERASRRTGHGSRASGSGNGSSVARRESDVGGRTGLSLSGFGLRSSGRPQLVGNGLGNLRVSGICGVMTKETSNMGNNRHGDEMLD